jgi:hypothetical protein
MVLQDIASCSASDVSDLKKAGNPNRPADYSLLLTVPLLLSQPTSGTGRHREPEFGGSEIVVVGVRLLAEARCISMEASRLTSASESQAAMVPWLYGASGRIRTFVPVAGPQALLSHRQ